MRTSWTRSTGIASTRQPAPCSWRRGARRRAEGDHREHRARPANRVVPGKDEGVCGDRFDVWSTHLCAIDGDKLVWNDQLSIPLNPMIGVIGVAPAGDPVNCGTPGSHGGNMDNTAITTGATLYFPVAVGRAVRLRRHAAMGDGRDQRVGPRWPATLRSRLLRCPTCTWLIRLSRTARTSASCVRQSLDAAADRAVHEMVDLLHDRTGIDEAELVMLLSLVADVQVCQMVDPQNRRFTGSQVRAGIAGVQAVEEEGGRAVAFSPDPIGGHLGGCVVPETCGFAAKRPAVSATR
ncbi:MAG: hypothetical protein ACLSVD_08715 [Eggerthellaceae bacterium]